MKIISKLTKNSEQRLFSVATLYGLSDIAVLAVGGFLLLPVYTHSLSQGEFGQYIAVRANLDIATYLLQLGLPSAVGRLYFDRKREGLEDSYLSSVILLLMICVVGAATLVLAFGALFWNVLSPSVPAFPAMSITIAIAAAGAFGSLTIVWLRSEQRVVMVVALQLAAAAVLAIMSILLLTQMQSGLNGILAALLVSALLPAAALFVLFRRRFRFTLNKSDIFETLHYAIPILIGYIAYFLLNRSGMLLLQRYASVEELAVFGLAQQLSMIAALACASFGAALQPAVFGAMHDDLNRILSRAALQLTFIMLAVCIVLMLFGSDIIGLIAPEEYADSSILLVIMVAANFTITFSLLSDTILLYHHRPKTSVLISIGSAGVASGAGLILVPIWHAEGAAISLASGLVFRMIVSQWIAWRISGQTQITLAMPSLVLVGLTALLSIAIAQISLPPWIMTISKVTICLALGFFFFMQRRFSAADE